MQLTSYENLTKENVLFQEAKEYKVRVETEVQTY